MSNLYRETKNINILFKQCIYSQFKDDYTEINKYVETKTISKISCPYCLESSIVYNSIYFFKVRTKQ